jgi:hypothetical protein
MPKKLSVQTVAATAKTLKKVAPSLNADEERVLRMRVGVGLAPSERLEQKTGTNQALASKLAQIELMAFRSMGQKIYGRSFVEAAAPKRAALSVARTPKDKIIKALKKR